MDNLQWIFSGIGTELLILAVGAIAAGFAIHKIVVKKSGKQVQKAKSRSNQRQELIIDSDSTVGDKCNAQNSIKQTQKAGKESKQVQIGGIKNAKQ